MPRLTHLSTRQGDAGDTRLADGSCHAKNAPRIEMLGEVDELNASLGWLLSGLAADWARLRAPLTQIQQLLFELGAECATPGQAPRLNQADVLWLEQQLTQLNGELPALKEFILPGGNPSAAACHLSRTVCRRAERRFVTLAQQEAINPEALKFLNRLSDLLFVIARHLALADGPPAAWQPRPKPA